MERHRDQELEKIRQTLLRMGGLVERMIGEAMQALVERDVVRAQAVIATDDEVDEVEKELDELCQRFIALQQPAAVDLRFLVATMKIATDLERMGDSAVNVAQAAEVLNREPRSSPTSTCRAWRASPRRWCATRWTASCSATRPRRSTSATATTRWTPSTSSSSASC